MLHNITIKEDLSKAYKESRQVLQTEASKRFSETYKQDVGGEKAKQEVDQERVRREI